MPPPTVVVRAQDDAVAACARRRARVEPKLRESACANDARRDGVRADVHRHGCGDLGELVDDDVEPVRDRIVTGRDEHVAARELAPLDGRGG